MSIWNAVLLGFFQGVAEFLPISSSGHISIIDNLFNIPAYEEGHMLFKFLLQLAALIAVLIVYWSDITETSYELRSLFGQAQQRSSYPGTRTLLMMFISSLPLLIILPIRKQLIMLQDHNVLVGIMIILSGCILYTADKMKPGKKNERSMTMFDALIIGLCQCAAWIPGLSRIGIAATAGIAAGLRCDFAVKYSLLLALPATFCVLILSIIGMFQTGVDLSCIPAYLIGTAVALISGIFAVNAVRYISAKGKFGRLSYYCWVVGVLGIVLFLIF